MWVFLLLVPVALPIIFAVAVFLWPMLREKFHGGISVPDKI